MNGTSGGILILGNRSRVTGSGGGHTTEAKKGKKVTNPKPAYSKADLELWSRNMVDMAPPRPATPGFLNVIDVASFSLGHDRNGMYMLVQPVAGGPPLMIALNPVAACALRDGIAVSGGAGGWYGRDGKPVVPDRAV
jgi:hypothetical protein